jgi:ATP-dependent DNA helicase PIF1
MTIDKLEVSLGEVFEWGQAYVALSRATSLQKLRILGEFGPNVIKTHPKVVTFYQNFVRSVFQQ